MAGNGLFRETIARSQAANGRFQLKQTMFASFHTLGLSEQCWPQALPWLKNIPNHSGSGKGVALAILGPGYDSSHPVLSACNIHTSSRNFVHEGESMLDSSQVGTALLCLAAGKAPQNHLGGHSFGIASDSTIIVCKTLNDDSIRPGATAEAVNWLREKWPDWQCQNLHTLIVLIPYGGQYMQDEMESIHRAIDEGIVVVCAAGDHGKGIAFPAALGNVICVSGNDAGPRGREVDVTEATSVKFPVTLLESTQDAVFAFAEARLLDENEHVGPPILQGTAVAATIVSGLIALLASRIRSLVDDLDESEHEIFQHDILKKHLKSGQLHNAVIRELLLKSSSDGSHHPHSVSREASYAVIKLLENKYKLGLFLLDVLERYVDKKEGSDPSKEDARANEISANYRKSAYLGLTGKGVRVGIIYRDLLERNKRFYVPRHMHYCQIHECSHEECVCCCDLDDAHSLVCAQAVKDTAPDAVIVTVKVVGDLSKCCLAKLREVDIICISVSDSYFRVNLLHAVSEAVLAGKIVLCSAGNDKHGAKNTLGYPGRLGNVLVIGARDRFFHRLEYSSTGRELDFLAPGVFRIESSREVETGTSLAVPAMAGFIAMLLQFINENMADEKVTAWAGKKSWDWKDISIWEAIHDVYAIRALLKIFVVKPQQHSEESGFGCVDFKKIWGTPIPGTKELVTASAKTDIYSVLKQLYSP